MKPLVILYHSPAGLIPAVFQILSSFLSVPELSPRENKGSGLERATAHCQGNCPSCSVERGRKCLAGELDAAIIDYNELFLIEGADSFFKNLFADAEQGVDIFGWTFIGDGNCATTIFERV